MRPSGSCLVALLALGLGACGKTDEEASAGDGGPPPEAGPAMAGDKPWTATSKSIQLTCGGFFAGVTRFRATREQLSAEQLQQLVGLTLVAPKAGCFEDGSSCEVVITQGEGTVATYTQQSGDSGCSDQTTPLIAEATLLPFERELPCRYSKAGKISGVDAPLPPDPRCWNGVFVGSDQSEAYVPLKVDAPGPRHIELDACDEPNRQGKLTASLLLPPATNTLATLAAVPAPAAGADHACASLDFTFSQPGSYELRIDVAPGFLPLGDFFLRFY